MTTKTAILTGLCILFAVGSAAAQETLTDLKIGAWTVGSTQDGRFLVRTPAIEDEEAMDGGEFTSLALVCDRAGGIKLSFTTWDGSDYPEILPYPSSGVEKYLPMTHNEIRGIEAGTLLGQLVVMERNAVRLGETFTFTFAGDPDQSESMFNMSGLEYLMGFMMKECSPA